MKNADMPAAPVLNGDNEPADFGHQFYRNGKLAIGLTKREVMAMHAPEIPDWFCDLWFSEYKDNDFYFCSGLTPSEVGVEKSRSITRHGKRAMYFAWRTHYADAMFAELEKQL